MKKFLLPLLLMLSFVANYAQPTIVSDEVKARNVLQIPRYSTLPGYGKLGGLVDVYMTTDSGLYVRRPWGWYKVSGGNYADYQGTRFEGQPVITWSGVGLIYNVFCPRYWINGVEYPAINFSVTLAAAPITQSRIDVIYANHLNNLGVLQGDSSISPIKKSVDELTQIEIGSIYLNPGDTTPPNLRIEWVYREGIEWDTINNMTHVDPLVFRSPFAPLNGTYNVRAGCYGPGSRFSFDAPELIAVDSFQSFSFWIKLNSTLASGMSMQGYNGNSPSSRKIPLLRGVWGLNPNFPGWQKLQVPMSQFFAGRMIGKLIFSMDESDCTNWQIDDISFQANVATITTPDVKWITIQADSGSITAKSNADILKAKGRGGIRTTADSSGFYIDGSGVAGGGGGANNYPTYLGFSGGVLTQGRNGLPALTANLDGRWLKYTDTPNLWTPKAVFLAHADSVATALVGKVPTTRTLTINGVAQDLSADRAWTIVAGGTTAHLDTVLRKNQYFIGPSSSAGNGLGSDSVFYRYPSVTGRIFGDTVRNFAVGGALMQPNLPSDSGYLPQLRQIPVKTPNDRFLSIEPSGNDIGLNGAGYDTATAGAFLRRMIDTAIVRGWPARSINITAIPILTASQRAFYDVVNGGNAAPTVQRCIDYRLMWFNAARAKGTLWTDLQPMLDKYGDSAIYSASTGTGDGFHANRFGAYRAGVALYERLYYGYDSTGTAAVAFDSTSLSNRINAKLNISDSGAMLLPYLRKGLVNNSRLVFSDNGAIKDTSIVSYDRANAAVGIGTATPNGSSILDLTSTNKGFLLPRMSGSNMLSIGAPAYGLQVVSASDSLIYGYSGLAWRAPALFYSGGNFFSAKAGSNSTGIGNIFMGVGAGASNVGGADNFALGTNALYSNVTTVDNVAMGNGALKLYTTSSGGAGSCLAIGTGALTNLVSGSGNVAIGTNAMQNTTSTVSRATAIGVNAFRANNTSDPGVAIGYNSAPSVNGGGLIIIGSQTLNNATTASGVVAIGNQTANSNTSISNLVAIGASASTAGASNSVSIGSSANRGNGGAGAVAIGSNALGGPVSNVQNKNCINCIAVGINAFDYPDSTANNSTIIGANANYTTWPYINRFGGVYNIVVGSAVSQRDTSGSYQFAAGGNGVRWFEKTTNGNFILNGSNGSNVSVNGSAALDIPSTNKGFLPPRMTKAERNLIPSPANGLVIYQTDNTPGLRTWNGTNWMKYTETAD